jgi:hypothetical protein
MNRLRLLSSAAAIALPLAACSPSPSPPVEAPKSTVLDAQRQALAKARALNEQADRHAAELDRAAEGGESPQR